MKQLKVIYAVVFLFAFSANNLKAEHIIGGEIFYECVGEGSYQFTLKLYRDCNSTGANFDAPGNFGVFNGNNQLVEIVQASIFNVQNINTSVASPCMVIPPNVCVQEGIYTFLVNVPDLTDNYTVVYQRCCRNGTIQNLIDPGAQGSSIAINIPPYQEVECNSSPSFNNFPPPVLCNMEQLEFDHSATETDGDSLAYSLCSPLIGGTQANPLPLPPSNPPWDEVTWGGGYDAETPLPGNPGLEIDPVTGLLTGIPTLQGQYVIGVCVEEWRDGNLLSVNTRDFQFNVAFCEPPSQALITEPEIGDLCQGLTVGFSSDSDPSNNFFWDFDDPDNDVPFSEEVNPFHTFSDTGVYVVTLITNPGFFCSDTAELVVPIYYAAQISAILDGTNCVGDQLTYNFSSTGIFDEGAPVLWNFGPGTIPESAEGSEVEGVVFPDTGPQSIEVSVLNNACSASDLLEIEVPPPSQVAIDPQTSFCAGYAYNFSQQSQNATMYNWNFGTGNDEDVSTDPNPQFVFPGDGEYNVSLTVSSAATCPVVVEETFVIASLLAPQVPEFDVQCFEENSFDFTAQGDFTSGADFLWTFENAVPETSASASVNGVLFLEPGTHQFELTISENGCTRSAEGSATVHVYPVADFSAAIREGCAPLEVSFSNLSTTQSTNASFSWDFGDGNSRGSGTTHKYDTPGIYTVTLTLENLNGCLGTDTAVKKEYINVFPVPTPGFSTDPLIISAFDPQIEITDLSEGGNACSYSFDNQVFNDCDFTHVLENVNPQTITQRISNRFGCTAETEFTFRVADHTIFVPNAFTPNGDGLNDIFEPVISGAAKYDMYIIDRWGGEVYAAEDVKRGWDGGGRNGEHFVQNGLYQYLIVVTDFSGWSYEYRGTVNLMR
ncbi:MAG: PKD domain-containing protein [Cryomorphaceae bacterium]